MRRVVLLGLLLAVLVCCSGRPVPQTTAATSPGPRMLVVLRPMSDVRAGELAGMLGRAFGLDLQALWFMRSLGVHCAVYELPTALDTQAMAARLRAHPMVELAQPERQFRVLAQESPEDSYLHLQSGFHAIHAREAQRWASGRGVRVALVDTGVDFAHPDLADAVQEAASFVLSGRDGFTEDAHGTAVAGVVAARSGNGHGIRGVAPAAELMALRACESLGDGAARCDSYALALALDHAIMSRPDLVNLSLAGPRDELVARLLERAIERNIVVVAAAVREPDARSAARGPAAGGDAVPSGTAPLSFPASLPGVLAVLSVDTRPRPPPVREPPAGGHARLAPGYEILSTAPGGRYDFSTGSSVAAAHVTGIVALLRELAPKLSPAEAAELLPAGRLVDACEAVARLRGSGTCPPPWSRDSSAPGNL